MFEVDKIFFSEITFRKISFPHQILDENNTNLKTNLTKILPKLTYHDSPVWYVFNWHGKNNICIHCNSVFHFSVHNQGQISKTIRKKKNMRSLTNTCCETHFHSLRIVLHSFIRYNTTDFWYTMHSVAVYSYRKQNSHNKRKHYFIRRFGLCVSHHQE